MDENKPIPPRQFRLDPKTEACLDLVARRCFFSSVAGALGALIFFRTPMTRWSSVAFCAGVGIGSACTECSYKFYGYPAKLPAVKISVTPASPDEQD
ncbi:hypothetical protein U1Q18_036924 [Sarracenia purpurea var. burkii]